jgi:hypothetical protein
MIIHEKAKIHVILKTQHEKTLKRFCKYTHQISDKDFRVKLKNQETFLLYQLSCHIC